MDTKADSTPLAISLALTDSVRYRVYCMTGYNILEQFTNTIGQKLLISLSTILIPNIIFCQVRLTCAQVAMMMATIPPEAPARIILTAMTEGTP